MSTWKQQDLDTITSRDEVRLAVDKRDGSAGTPVIMWSVVVDANVYVRAVRGDQSPWYRRALVTGSGVLSSGSLQTRVNIETAPGDVTAALDAAYLEKYGHKYAKNIVDSVVSPIAQAAALRLVPAE